MHHGIGIPLHIVVDVSTLGITPSYHHKMRYIWRSVVVCPIVIFRFKLHADLPITKLVR